MKMKNKYAKFAFTLAEALLAMTILGVIAALMLRTVNRINPDKDKQLFIRTFHAIETAAGEVVSDTSFYDSDMHAVSDFSTDPLPTAKVELYASNLTYPNKPICSKKSTYKTTDCNKIISSTNAVCYLIASKMNLNGITNCSSGANVLNFRLGNGACIYGLAGQSVPFEFVIDPSCKGIKYGYAAKIFSSGSMTVPESSSTYTFNDSHAQEKAYIWMQQQTDVKKRDYDFE